MKIVMVVLALSGSLALASPADASCIQLSVAQKVAGADVIVIGRVVAVGDRSITVEVRRVHKGSAASRIEVVTRSGPPGSITSIDYEAQAGTEHTLYLARELGGFSTNQCMGSHAGDLTAEESAALGSGAVPQVSPVASVLPGTTARTEPDAAQGIALAVAAVLALVGAGALAYARRRA